MNDSALWHKNAAGILVPTGDTYPLPTQLSGSTITKAQAIPIFNTNQVPTIETIINAVSIAAGSYQEFNINPTTEKEIWLAVNINKQPWTLSTSLPIYTATDGGEYALFPVRSNYATAHSDTVFPVMSLCLGQYVHTTVTGLTTPTTLTEAKQYLIPYTANLKGRITNKHATDTATVTVRIIRIWR